MFVAQGWSFVNDTMRSLASQQLMALYYPLELNKTPSSSSGDDSSGEREAAPEQKVHFNKSAVSSATSFGLPITQRGIGCSTTLAYSSSGWVSSTLPLTSNRRTWNFLLFRLSDSRCLPTWFFKDPVYMTKKEFLEYFCDHVISIT